jgi:hypothetical protein
VRIWRRFVPLAFACGGAVEPWSTPFVDGGGLMADPDRKPLTAERLRELLHYDPETGVFTRIARVRGTRPGAVAGSMTSKGYRQVRIDGRQYQAHRLAWLYMTGEWPADQIDHRDGDPANNRFDNLRAATHAENQQNRAPPKNSTSGLIGASWQQRSRRWVAQIDAGGRQVYLGLFDTPEEAHAAYLSAKARLHAFQPVALRPAPSLPMLAERG